MKCLGLAKIWENSEEPRDRIRDDKRVLVYADTDKFCKPNRVNAVSNACVMRPVLVRLGKTSGHKLPHIDDLTRETTTLFERCGLSTGNKAPYKAGMEIKRLSGFVKRRSYRGEVTKELG